MRQTRQRILCVDDHADIREMLTALLGAEGYDATAVSAQDAARFVLRDGFDLFILDKVLRTDAGLEMCRELRRRHPHVPVIIYSADASERHHMEAARAGATACVDKPHIEPLVGAVKKLTGRNECRRRSCSAARERVVVGGDVVQDELHGERRHHDSRDARDDVHLTFADARR